MRRIEISHKIEMGIKTYHGLPEPYAEYDTPTAWVGCATSPVRAHVIAS